MIANSWQARFWWCAPDKRKSKKRRKWHMHEVYPVSKYQSWAEKVGRQKMVVTCK